MISGGWVPISIIRAIKEFVETNNEEIDGNIECSKEENGDYICVDEAGERFIPVPIVRGSVFFIPESWLKPADDKSKE